MSRKCWGWTGLNIVFVYLGNIVVTGLNIVYLGDVVVCSSGRTGWCGTM